MPAQWFVGVRAAYQDSVLGYLCQNPDVVLAVILETCKCIKHLSFNHRIPNKSELNTEKAKNVFISCQQNAGQNQDIHIANKSFENVTRFKCLGKTVTNRNFKQE